MSIADELVAVLEADSAVTALLGAPPNTRIYPEILPQDPTYPAVTYFVVDTPREDGLEGPLGFAWPRFQLDIWDTGYGGKVAVAKAVRQRLNGYSDTTIGSCRLVDESDMPPETEAGPAGKTVRRVRQDYRVGHPET